MAKLKTFNKKTGKWEEMPYFTTPADEKVIEEKVRDYVGTGDVLSVSSEVVNGVLVVKVKAGDK